MIDVNIDVNIDVIYVLCGFAHAAYSSEAVLCLQKLHQNPMKNTGKLRPFLDFGLFHKIEPVYPWGIILVYFGRKEVGFGAILEV